MNLKEYFRAFGTPDYPDDNYWDEDPLLIQVIFGILIAPIFLVGYVAVRLMTLRVVLPICRHLILKSRNCPFC